MKEKENSFDKLCQFLDNVKFLDNARESKFNGWKIFLKLFLFPERSKTGQLSIPLVRLIL